MSISEQPISIPTGTWQVDVGGSDPDLQRLRAVAG
jgi:hypothetical protein